MQEQPRGATSRPRSGAEAGRTPCPRGSSQEELPHVRGQGQWPGGATLRSRSGLEELFPTFKVRRGDGEEIPLVQGKRNPSKTVGIARGHQRADTLKPYSQKTSQSNHTRTTALSNSMKLSHAHRATQDGRVMVEMSDRMWSLLSFLMASHLSITALFNLCSFPVASYPS